MTKQTYTLNCDRCGGMFVSYEAFPNPHICGKCSKQEEIREGIQEIIFESWDKPVKSADLAFDILFYLHSQGCVLKVERELPEIRIQITPPSNGEPIGNPGYIYIRKTQEMMRDAGYVAVVPLIEEL